MYLKNTTESLDSVIRMSARCTAHLPTRVRLIKRICIRAVRNVRLTNEGIVQCFVKGINENQFKKKYGSIMAFGKKNCIAIRQCVQSLVKLGNFKVFYRSQLTVDLHRTSHSC